MTRPTSSTVITPPRLWRIASDTPGYTADDAGGTGAKLSGGRWNRIGTAMLYTATSRALACLESMVHLGAGSLPLNRYLVEIEVQPDDWLNREVFDASTNIGWDAEPAGQVSLDWGTTWAGSVRSLLAQVPSMVVPEEANVLINPLHPDAGGLRIRKVRKWLFDARI